MQRSPDSTRASWLRFPVCRTERSGPASRRRAAPSRSSSAIRSPRRASGPFQLPGPQRRPTSYGDTGGARSSAMAAAQKTLLRTSDLAQAIDAVSAVYCAHEVELRGSNRGVSAALEVIRGGFQPVVGLRYSPPLTIDPGDFPQLMLTITCLAAS